MMQLIYWMFSGTSWSILECLSMSCLVLPVFVFRLVLHTTVSSSTYNNIIQYVEWFQRIRSIKRTPRAIAEIRSPAMLIFLMLFFFGEVKGCRLKTPWSLPRAPENYPGSGIQSSMNKNSVFNFSSPDFSNYFSNVLYQKNVLVVLHDSSVSPCCRQSWQYGSARSTYDMRRRRSIIFVYANRPPFLNAMMGG